MPALARARAAARAVGFWAIRCLEVPVQVLLRAMHSVGARTFWHRVSMSSLLQWTYGTSHAWEYAKSFLVAPSLYAHSSRRGQRARSAGFRGSSQAADEKTSATLRRVEKKRVFNAAKRYYASRWTLQHEPLSAEEELLASDCVFSEEEEEQEEEEEATSTEVFGHREQEGGGFDRVQRWLLVLRRFVLGDAWQGPEGSGNSQGGMLTTTVEWIKAVGVGVRQEADDDYNSYLSEISSPLPTPQHRSGSSPWKSRYNDEMSLAAQDEMCEGGGRKKHLPPPPPGGGGFKVPFKTPNSPLLSPFKPPKKEHAEATGGHAQTATPQGAEAVPEKIESKRLREPESQTATEGALLEPSARPEQDETSEADGSGAFEAAHATSQSAEESGSGSALARQPEAATGSPAGAAGGFSWMQLREEVVSQRRQQATHRRPVSAEPLQDKEVGSATEGQGGGEDEGVAVQLHEEARDVLARSDKEDGHSATGEAHGSSSADGTHSVSHTPGITPPAEPPGPTPAAPRSQSAWPGARPTSSAATAARPARPALATAQVRSGHCALSPEREADRDTDARGPRQQPSVETRKPAPVGALPAATVALARRGTAATGAGRARATPRVGTAAAIQTPRRAWHTKVGQVFAQARSLSSGAAARVGESDAALESTAVQLQQQLASEHALSSGASAPDRQPAATVSTQDVPEARPAEAAHAAAGGGGTGPRGSATPAASRLAAVTARSTALACAKESSTQRESNERAVRRAAATRTG